VQKNHRKNRQKKHQKNLKNKLLILHKLLNLYKIEKKLKNKYFGIISIENTNMKQTLITDYYKPIKIFGYNAITQMWHCLQCGINMGKNNSRQLCGKTYCYDEFINC
jgi:hypothetical protein